MQQNINKLTNPEEAIVKTIAFFDLFDYPLTFYELWRYCSSGCSYNEILELCARSGFLRNRAGMGQGQVFLRGRERILAARQERYYHTDRKMRRARLVAGFYRLLPWVRMIAVSNIIGSHNLRDDSDIDLFAVVSPGRIWISRLFMGGLAKLFRLRPEPGRERDKICLSFYITADNLDLRRFMLDRDIYFRYWLAGLAPVFDQGGVYERLIKANRWLYDYFPNWRPREPASSRRLERALPPWLADTIDLLIGGLDRYFKNWQLKILPGNLRSKLNRDTRVVMNDQVLRLYANDRRQYYRDAYQKKINALLEAAAPLTQAEEKAPDLKEFFGLPRLADGRIDYSTARRAPVLTVFLAWQGKILLLKRSNLAANYKGLWSTVAGYLDEEKPLKQKALEEVYEETGIKPENIKSIRLGEPYEFHDQAADKVWVVYPALAELRQREKIEFDWEHNGYCWASPEALPGFETPPNLLTSYYAAVL